MPRILTRNTVNLRTLSIIVSIGALALFVLPAGFLDFIQPTAHAAATFTVNSTGDGADSNPNDGICDDGTGHCTLRAAIQQANATAGTDTINFSVTGTINLTGALPDLSTDININGPGANTLTVRRDTGGNYRVFNVGSGATVTISAVTISGGNADLGGGVANSGTLTLSNSIVSGNTANGGGGIYNALTNSGALLTIDSCIVSNNTAFNINNTISTIGGAIENSITGSATAGVVVKNSTISGNAGGGIVNIGNGHGGAATVSVNASTISGNTVGGGLYNASGPDGSQATGTAASVILIDSTISGNSSVGRGGGIYNTSGGSNSMAVITVNNSTITANVGHGLSSGGGIYNDHFTFSGTANVRLRSTIVAGNSDTGGDADDIATPIDATSSYNLIGTGGSGGLTDGTNNNQVGVSNPDLGPLADNGGPTRTHALLPGSPAIDRGKNFSTLGNSPVLTDQRGFVRISDLDDSTFPNATGGDGSDIGAFEIQPSEILVVNSLADTSDGSCDAQNCTLREALNAANASADYNEIYFAVAGTINLTGALPDINTNLALNGPGAKSLTIQRSTGGQYRIFTIATGVTARISGLTLTGGDPGGGNGGGGISNSGTLTLTEVAVSNNNAIGGGGIYNPSGTVNIVNSTISGNTAGFGGGGGIFSGGSGSLNVLNSTISGNSDSGGSGGGIFSFSNVNLTSSTVANNQNRGIQCLGSCTTILTNSIVANNQSTVPGQTDLGDGGGGTFVSYGYNLIKTPDSVPVTEARNSGTNIYGQDPKLGPLADNGGPTQTQTLLAGSPAIDKGKNFAADFSFDPGPRDQRGARRPFDFTSIAPAAGGDDSDIGAVEVNDYSISITAGDGQSTPIKTAFATQLKVVVNESGHAVSGVPVTFTAPSFGASGTFNGATQVTVTTDANGLATAPIFTANSTAGGPYNVVASLDSGAPAVIFSMTNLKGDQTITFGTLPNRTFGDADFQLSAAASSGLAVTFAAGGQCTVSGSTVHLNGAGSCTITASQPGDSNYNAASDVNQSFQIAKAASATTLSSSANPSSVGRGVTFTATVMSTAGTPTGTVVFKDGGTTISGCGSVSLSSGQAACTTSSLSLGNHIITADYSGDANFNASTGTLSGVQTVIEGFEFSQDTYTANERDGSVTITVKRIGDTSQAASVDYATDDGSTPSVAVPCSAVTGIALERCDYTRAAGTLRFAAGDTQKTFVVLVNDDSYAEGTETTHLRLSNPFGAQLAQQSSATLQIADDTQQTTNPVDDPSFFVRQHYHDFLNREPDASGLQFWTGGITSCGSDANCREVKRVDTSAAFFLSIEFQQTGYLVERIYKTSFGDATGNSTLGGAHQLSVPVVRFAEFLRDTQEVESTPTQVIVGQGNWQQQLEDNKAAFALEFVARQRFTTAFPSSMTADAFVNQLNTNAGGVLTSADIAQLEAVFGGASSSSNDPAKRAQVLRQVAENATLQQREFDRAFVLMQYIGYLRRNPNDAPDADYTGYEFWLSKLDQFHGNYIQAEMVKAFIQSDEYRHRFGQ